MAFSIYTDGGCSGNPGPGGWAYVIVQDTFQGPAILAEQCGGEKVTTNNRMEIQAAISALEALPSIHFPHSVSSPESVPNKISLYTDSQYLQKGMTEWLKNWKNKGWRTADKQPVKNQDLWQKLDALSSLYSITWIWVKGHAGVEYNERCDALTQKAIQSFH
ncbi:ribonuclease H [Spirochaetia bacterium]|nr:ribonuclease H [Spirochaetia bacterium]